MKAKNKAAVALGKLAKGKSSPRKRASSQANLVKARKALAAKKVA